MTELKQHPAVINFTVRGIPRTKGSTKSFYIKKLNRTVTTADNPKLKNWADNINYLAQVHAPDVPWDGPVLLFLFFKMQKPKSAPKTRRIYAVKKPDLDKLIRAVKDSLTGVIYNDDSQVIHVYPWKDYSPTPGIDLKVISLSNFLADYKDPKKGYKDLCSIMFDEYFKNMNRVFNLSFSMDKEKSSFQQKLLI